MVKKMLTKQPIDKSWNFRLASWFHHAAVMGKRRPVIIFSLLAYWLSWLFWLPMIWGQPDNEALRMIGSFGPTAAGLILIWRLEGKQGLTRVARSLLHWNVGWSWWLISLFGTAVLAGLALVLHLLLGADPAGLDGLQPLYAAPIAFGYVLLTSVIGEEIGWRGFALPYLQRHLSALGSSLILGCLWGLWHLPLSFIPGNFHQDLPVLLFLGQSVIITSFMTWLYNNTKGSLLIAHVFHTVSNVTFFMLPVLPAQVDGSLRPLSLTIGLAFIVVLTLFRIYGPEHLIRRE